MTRPPWRLFPPILAILALLAALAPDGARAGPFERAMGAVLILRGQDDGRFLGSGFIWDDGAVAVTAAHVVEGSRGILAETADGRQAEVAVIAADPVRDVAVLSLPEGWGPGLAPAAAPALGQPVWALGAPLGAGFSLTRGIVSASARQVDAAVPLRFLQHDAAVNPGSSGGPLVDAAGGLLGMNLRIADGSRLFAGIAYAITAADLARIVAGLRDGTLRQVPRLGLALRPLSPPLATAFGQPATGLLIDAVDPASAAAAAGLRPGDLILTAGGSVLDDPGDLAFAAEAAGGQMAVTFRRQGRDGVAMMALRSPPPPSFRRPETRHSPVALADLGLRVEGTVLRLPEGTQAALFGLADGDRVLAINGIPPGPQGVADLILTAPALFLIERASGTLHIWLDPFAPPTGPVGGANVLDPDVILF